MEKVRHNRMKKAVFFITGLAVLILSLAAAIPLFRLASDPEAFRRWVDSFGHWGRLIYVAAVCVQVVVAFLPGEPLELAGGYAFGALEGTALALIGIVLGSALVFLLVRRFGMGLVEHFFPGQKLGESPLLRDPDRTRAVAFWLMLIPGTPKDLLSYLAGLTGLRLAEWLLIVTVARIPSVIGSTISGGAAGSADYALAAAALGLTALTGGAGLLWYRRWSKRPSDENSPI